MIRNVKDFLVLNDEEKKEFLIPYISAAINNINYIDFDFDKIYYLVLNYLTNTENKKINKKLINIIVKEAVNANIKSVISNNTLDTVNSYINNNFNSNKLDNLIKLEDFFNKYNISIKDSDIPILVEKNNYLKNSLNSIINNNNISELFNNSTLISIIEMFAIIQGIEIDDFNYSCEEYYNNLDNNSIDPIDTYLNDISKYKLLSSEEEIELAKKIANGDEEAKRLFIKSNLRLVVSIAKRYTNTGAQLQDLIQEGNIGLIEAVDRFDYTLGYKFSTYAIWWIKQTIRHFLAKHMRNISVAYNINDKITKIKKYQIEFYIKNGREASIKELSEHFSVSEKRIEEIIVFAQDTVSLDQNIKDNESITLGDSVTDNNSISPEDYAFHEKLKDDIEILLSILNERERQIIIRRFGLDGNNSSTLAEIGKEYNLTRERIRQIENSALKKLYKDANDKKLYNYYRN